MSKEQTPMEKQLKDWSPLKFNGEMKWRNEDVIEFANAKVLEALESREHIDCGKDGVKTICPVCRNVLWTTKQK
jgi:hypothetical protein